MNVENAAVLLLIAAVVAIITRRLHLPYSVGLVAAGIVLAFLPFAPEVSLTKELIFSALLPPLLFEAALYLPWRPLRRDLPVTFILATVGVCLSAGVTSFGMRYLAGWQWSSALIFGVLIAATDPVSVIATFREVKAHGRLLLLIESESLFNDGTAAVAFTIAIALAMGQNLTPAAMAASLLTTAGGGILCGAVVAGGALLLAGHTEDYLVEITITTVAAYGSFLLAEHFQLSGVLATITAGLVVGNPSPINKISTHGKEALQAFWEYAAFTANSLVFLMIGIHEAHQNFQLVWLPAVIAIALVIFGRAVAVYPCCFLFSRSRLRVRWRNQHVLFGGGLRGALALALALGLPPEISRAEKSSRSVSPW